MPKNRKPKKKRKQHNRAFMVGFMMTLCLALFAFGMIQADFQSRRMSTGDSAAPFQIEKGAGQAVYLRIYTMGIDERLDISGVSRAAKAVREFVSLSS